MKTGVSEEKAYRALQLPARKNLISLREAAGMVPGDRVVDERRYLHSAFITPTTFRLTHFN
jgi:hypothetical protein